MTIPVPETGRITLTLTTRTIKAMRLLALLKDETQNDVAEALLIAGGLYNAVDSEWNAGQPKPTAAALVHVPPTPILQAVPTPPKPASSRDGWMPEIPKITDEPDDLGPSPWMKDLKDENPPW